MPESCVTDTMGLQNNVKKRQEIQVPSTVWEEVGKLRGMTISEA